MEIGKVSVGGYGGVCGLPMSQQDRDQLREKRNLGLQKIKTLGFANLLLSALTIADGIAIMVISARGSIGWPVFNFGPFVVGIVMFIGGIMAVMAYKKNEGSTSVSSEETPTAVKGLFIGYYVICVTCISLCCVAAAFSFMSAGFCASNGSRYEIYCYPDKDANVTVAVIGGILCVILAILCIVACIFFCVYARSFGFKNRYERAMEVQMGMMMRAMQEQQGHYQGQPGQGQWGQYGVQQAQYQGQPQQGKYGRY